jgi:hypothetical protein
VGCVGGGAFMGNVFVCVTWQMLPVFTDVAGVVFRCATVQFGWDIIVNRVLFNCPWMISAGRVGRVVVYPWIPSHEKSTRVPRYSTHFVRIWSVCLCHGCCESVGCLCCLWLRI